MPLFDWAPTAYRMLNGALCIFKPEGECVHKVIKAIQVNLARDLNALPCYSHEIPIKSQKLKEENNGTSISVVNQPKGITDWTEHRLVLGERYIPEDFKISFIDGISRHSSGVLILGIGNYGSASTSMLALSKFLRVYHIKGRFGWATDNFSPKGKIIERTSYRHITSNLLEKMCAAAQAAHNRQMYIYSGVNPDSQDAYELAASGIIRPVHRNTPSVLYGIKCIDFSLPDFTLEIHSINERCLFLRRFIHDIALKLKTTAVCTGIRRLRYGNFDLDRALVRQEWNLENIVNNIKNNEQLLSSERLFVGMQTEQTQLLSYNKEDQKQLSSKSHSVDETSQEEENTSIT